ncbi:FtsX-like permease family protein [Rhodanobacter glycinis]|uniref:FtsX-like permease family protein n=1 Tax=Rhodanobacter glycinis TaxID=582702 RepID=A0A5B9E3K7_9GAMM|nr:ABC transporter permease [Rhodanobacter glycinis]QEE25555.1 FtsX-like permease family protein [Rhodanobacter glycinis]
MFGYYFDLALRSLRRNKALTALMVLAIALGIGASMTTLTVLHVLSGDPLPGRSGSLYYPQIDPRDSQGYLPGKSKPMDQVTWIDGMNLLEAKRADRQALMTGGSVAVQPGNSTLDPFYEAARYSTADFFPMFGVPFQYGHAWDAADDGAHARVAVISSQLDAKLFGGGDSTDKTLRLDGTAFRIVGVIGDWNPNPHFYDLNRKSYNENEGVFVPLSTSQDLGMAHDGSVNCWGNGGGGSTPIHSSPCVWLQFWVQLDTPAKAVEYKAFLVHYSEQQKALGRFGRPPNVQLRDVMQWLDYNMVVPDDVRLQTGLAFGFLLVCLVNTVGLMLAKFLRRAGELGVRRALGASRRALFAQLLVESGVIGLMGGIGGLLLALAGLWLVRRQPAEYAALAHLDPAMLLATFLLALAASLLAGLLPAWRACQITPALQLKSN